MAEPASAHAAQGEPSDGARAPDGGAELPIGLRRDWPVPRQLVLGADDSFFAHVQSWIVCALLALLARLPISARNALVGVLARLARRFDRRHSRAAREFLRQALGPALTGREIESRVLDAWKHLLHVTVESEGFARHVPTARIREHFEVTLTDDVRRVLASGQGSFIVTAHVGNWEAGAAILPWLGFDPLYSVAKPPRNRPLSMHLQRVRERRGLRLLPRRGAMKDVPAVIHAGGSLTMLLDQRARKNPVLATFFGRPARCDRSVGVMIKRLQVPVVFGACYRTQRPYHYHLIFSGVLWPADVVGLSQEAIARRVNAELERMILVHPEQYFWMHDRYRGT